MSQPASRLSLEELRDRIKAAGVAIPEARHEMIRTLLGEALAPVRAMDARALKTVEPAVTFDAEGLPRGEDHGG
jgi:hypothetical protein